MEIGASFGYNLAYLLRFFPNSRCVGLEPSSKAIEYGAKKFSDLVASKSLKFVRGTSDLLPFEDASFDVIIIGFCLYQVDRKLLTKTISEIDRCLKQGGFLVITDFDIPYMAKKANTHNELTPTYKQNYANCFENFGYSLIEKTTYNANIFETNAFPNIVDERVSTQILYKEFEYDEYREV